LKTVASELAEYNLYLVNIRLSLREAGWEGVAWINLVQDRTNGSLL